MTASTDFASESARYLRDVYLPRLKRACETLPAEDLWWQPHQAALSMGNILLHLEGNVRQWLVSGLGGEKDARDRASEFKATTGPPREELLERLGATIETAIAVFSAFDEERLQQKTTIQGFETPGLKAIFHVDENFSWHTGQAVWIAKARAGKDHGLAFYNEAKINAARNA